MLKERDQAINGATYEINVDHIDNPIFVTINHTKNDSGKYQLYEIFINSASPSVLDWSPIAARLLSAVFRQGGDTSFVIDEVKNMFAAESFFYKKKKYHSIMAIVGELLENHIDIVNRNSK